MKIADVIGYIREASSRRGIVKKRFRIGTGGRYGEGKI
jgi:hypothetical protein